MNNIEQMIAAAQNNAAQAATAQQETQVTITSHTPSQGPS